MIYKWQHIITIMLSPYVVSIAGIKPDFNTFLLIFSHIGQKNFNVHNGPIIFFKKSSASGDAFAAAFSEEDSARIQRFPRIKKSILSKNTNPLQSLKFQ